MKYSFMSFSCPELSLDEILSVAARLGYDGVEPRISSGHGHGIEVVADAAARRAARRKSEQSGVAFSCLATSCQYCNKDKNAEMIAQTDLAIDLAADVGAPCIRVFGGATSPGMERPDAVKLLARSLLSVADHAAKRNVTVCLETHDHWCNPDDVANVMRRVDHPAIGVNWDIMHPVRAAGWTIEASYKTLKPWIRHTHVHDGADDGKNLILKPIGQGKIDHAAALSLLKAGGFQGFISGEWIAWEPWDVHLPRELATMKKLEAQA